MEMHRISIIFFALIVVQTVYCKPRDYSSAEIEWAKNIVNIDPSASDKLLIFVVDNLMTIPKKYAANAVNATRHVLKDEAIEDGNETEIKDFKEALNMVLHKYDPSAKKMESYYKTMDFFAEMVEYYYDRDEPEYKFIIKLLEKYDCKNVAMYLNDHLDTFFAEYRKMFEEHKSEFKKPILEWYDKFITLTDLQDKLKAIIEFIDLV